MKILIALLFALSAFGADVNGIVIGMPTPFPVTSYVGHTYATFTLDAGSKVAWVFMAPVSETATSILFRYGARTGSTPILHRASIQGVNASGDPDGSILASGTFNSPADNSLSGTIQAIALQFDSSGATQTSYPLVRGTHYSLVVEACPDSLGGCAGAVVTTSNTLAITHSVNNLEPRMSYPYALTFNGSVWATSTDYPIFGYRTSASTTRGNPLQLITQPTVINLGSEMGMHFNLPCTFVSSYKVRGVRSFIQNPLTTSKTFAITIYQGTAVVQGPKVIGSGDVRIGNTQGQELRHFFSDATLATLSCGTTYILGYAPQDSGTTSFGLQQVDVALAQDRSAFPGGTWFGRSSRTACTTPCNATGTAWAADTDTTRPMVDLILDDMTQPTGGSGGAHGSVVARAKPTLRDSLADLFASILPTYKAR